MTFMGYLLDTNHASAVFLKDPRLAAEAVRADEELFLPMPALGELWFMVFNSRRVEENRERLIGFLQSLIVLPFDELAAEEFGRIRVDLRRKGRPIPQIDVQIAAIARQRNLTVLTDDGHFGAIDGIQVENWLR